MKRTRRKNILRGIKSSLNRFLSILFIVALGSGFMAGLAATSPDMYETADHYMDDYDYFDIDLKSPLLFTKEDVSVISALPYVEKLQSATMLDMVFRTNKDESYATRVYGFLDKNGETRLNRFHLIEGRLPENPGECVVQISMGRYFGGDLKLLDTLTLSEENTDFDKLRSSVSEKPLTIVGFVESPMCISIVAEPTTAGSGRVQLSAFVYEDFFQTEAPTDLFLTLTGGKEMNSFHEDYASFVKEKTKELESIAAERSALRAASLRTEGEESLSSLQSFLQRVRSTAEIGKTMAASTVTSLMENAEILAQVSSKNPLLAASLQKVQQSVTSTLQNAAEADVDGLIAELSEEITAVEESLAALSSASWLIKTREDSAGYQSFDGNVGKVAALSKVFPVFFFLVALLVALTTMTRLVEENRTQIGTLKALGFSNGQVLFEYLFYSLSSSVLGCILGFFVGFRLFPSAISSAYGMMFILPKTLTPFRPDIAALVAPVTIGSIFLATLFACYEEFRAVPANLIRQKAPAAGKRILLERLPFFWKRLSFTHKVSCRNLFRYKKRFFMTVIGVAGCSALLLTGFGLRDSINDIVEKQYEELYRYELTVLLKEDADPFRADADLSTEESGLSTDESELSTDESELSTDKSEFSTEESELSTESTKLSAILKDSSKISGALPYAEESGKVIFGEESDAVTLAVPGRTEDFSSFITLRNRLSKETLPFPENGILLTEKLCETLHIKVGDTVTLENEKGLRSEAEVVGIAENYITSFAYLSMETYRSFFGAPLEETMLLVTLADGAVSDDVIRELMECDSVLYVNSSLSLKENFSDSIKSIDGVILVLILSAGLLCIVVLYNLTNVNICERRKELATIRVLGFHKNEVERYIFRETNLLSFFGSLVGLLIGIWLHSYVVHTVEIDQVMFGRNIYPLSYLLALIISMVFTLLVNFIMRARIRKIDMVEAMKANE